MLPTDRYETVLHGHVCHLVHHEGDDAGNVETVGDAGEDTVGGVCGHSSPQNVLQVFSSSALGLVLVHPAAQCSGWLWWEKTAEKVLETLGAAETRLCRSLT